MNILHLHGPRFNAPNIRCSIFVASSQITLLASWINWLGWGLTWSFYLVDNKFWNSFDILRVTSQMNISKFWALGHIGQFKKKNAQMASRFGKRFLTTTTNATIITRFTKMSGEMAHLYVIRFACCRPRVMEWLGK